MSKLRTNADLKVYLNEIASYPRISRADEHDLAVRSRAGDELAREWLIRCNLRLVVRLCKARHQRTGSASGLPLAELIAEGNLALVYAVDSFTPGQGFRLSTHVKYRVQQALRSLYCKLAPNRLPFGHDSLTRVMQFNRTAEALVGPDGSRPTFDEVCDAMRLSGRGRVEMRHKLEATAFHRQSDEVNPVDSATGRERRPEVEAEVAELATLIREKLDRIDPEYAEVLRARYGIDRDGPRTQVEIARDLGVSVDTVQAIESIARRRLADHLDAG